MIGPITSNCGTIRVMMVGERLPRKAMIAAMRNALRLVLVISLTSLRVEFMFGRFSEKLDLWFTSLSFLGERFQFVS
jgi:hypothetical protein